jgi:hypothetical protein
MRSPGTWSCRIVGGTRRKYRWKRSQNRLYSYPSGQASRYSCHSSAFVTCGLRSSRCSRAKSGSTFCVGCGVFAVRSRDTSSSVHASSCSAVRCSTAIRPRYFATVLRDTPSVVAISVAP